MRIKKIYSDIVCGHGRNNELHVIYVKDKQIETFTKISNSRYPIQVFYRLLIGELLPETVERVLYLDGAIIVRKSLRNLWPFDLENVDVGAVPDAMSVMLSYYNRLQYSMKKGYVNAGGGVVNLKYWREHNLSKYFLDFMRTYPERIVLNDQDVVNFVVRDCKKFIPLKYNVQTMFLYKNEYQHFSIYQFKEDYDEARWSPSVIHYSGCRPWEENSKHPFKEEFF